LYTKKIDIFANQLLVKIDKSFEAIIDLKNINNILKNLSILLSSQNSRNISDAVNEHESFEN